MAQYEEAASNVVDTITNSGLNDATKGAITSLLGDTSGDAKIVVATYEGGKVADDVKVVDVPADAILNVDPGAPIIIMNADAQNGANVVLSANQERAIVATKQDDKIVFEGDAAVTVETGGGNDEIRTGNGNNVVTVTGEGDSTVVTGTGNDEVVVTGKGKVNIQTAGGDNVIKLATDQAEVSVTGGEGFDKVQLDDGRGNHEFSVVDGKAVMHSEYATTMQNVQVVEFTGDGSVAVLADNHDKSVVAKMYEVVFDREGDLGGLKYWMERVDQGDSLDHVVRSFVNSEEFNTKYANVSDENFLTDLYQNMAGREAYAEGMAYWMDRMANGLSRADVAWAFAESAEATIVMGIDGDQYVIDLF